MRHTDGAERVGRDDPLEFVLDDVELSPDNWEGDHNGSDVRDLVRAYTHQQGSQQN